MGISVIICTYNRCQSLGKALGSIADLTLPESIEWEVLVVDNNSSDQTHAVVEDFCRRHPGRFRYLFEPLQGKSHALNAGIREARGDIVAFTDDDVTVEPTWLENLTSALHDGEWAGAGGCVLPERSFAPPPWLPVDADYASGPLALFNPGSGVGQLSEPPIGNNMAFRKEIFDRHGGFRTDLGPRPGNEIRNEDSELGDRLLRAGERLRYEPSATVYHAVPENRVQKQYFLDWWYDKARTEIRQFGISRDNASCAGVPFYLLGRFAAWTWRWTIAIKPAVRFKCKLKLWMVAGYIVESYRIALAERKHPTDCATQS